MMTTRWMIATAGALGVGVLTASAMLGPRTRVQVESADAADPAHADVVCKSDKKANLDFTVKDMHGASVRLADVQGQSPPDQLLGDMVPALQGGVAGADRLAGRL